MTWNADTVVVDPARVARWKAIWAELYAEKLPRPQHDARRDAMFEWAYARGPAEAEACRKGQIASIPFGSPLP